MTKKTEHKKFILSLSNKEILNNEWFIYDIPFLLKRKDIKELLKKGLLIRNDLYSLSNSPLCDVIKDLNKLRNLRK